ncbi:hypothetical protein LSUE1_G005480 [Lachnellula suecica]|uniref:Prolyl 4-hydroxylase alpha subunit domain-containing protein n=1 Tax=Lachnellula suecica TaxID=602035 RepID=A0A8T9C5E3_9HELO|nr:hypothetical protein LSUE1_G005480 [Lachnellula suecica]
MTSILQKVRNKAKKDDSFLGPNVVRTNYTSKPVAIPDDFLAPLADPSILDVKQIDFKQTPLPEYDGLYAVVLDNVLSPEECLQLTRMAEQSAGAHGDDKYVENNGWKPAMVNAGQVHEFLALDYRNSDRIIWDEQEIVKRLWTRIMQDEGMKEYFSVMEGQKYVPVVGDGLLSRAERWRVAPKAHCDGTYETPNGEERSFFTLHLYLNDSAQALGIKKPLFGFLNGKTSDEMLRGGATTFHSRDKSRRLDVDPMAGRVLIFQQRRLLHSGDYVTAGVKYTVRTDLMYGFELPEDENREDMWDSETGKLPWN